MRLSGAEENDQLGKENSTGAHHTDLRTGSTENKRQQEKREENRARDMPLIMSNSSFLCGPVTVLKETLVIRV